jgi:glycosyltransferase involved in cell wall biosynthesis
VTDSVLLVVSTLDGTGPGRVLTTLAEHLTGDWSPVLVTTHGVKNSELIAEARRAGIPVEHLGMRGIWDVRGVARFGQLLRRYRPKVVHTRTIRADLVGRVAAAARVPVVNNLVNLYPDDSIAMHGQLAGTVLTGLVRATRRAAAVVVANAEAVAVNAREVFAAAPERVRVVYDGIDLDRFQGRTPADLRNIGIEAGDTVCVSVARLHPQKGLEDLVAAAALLRNEPRLHVLVVGDGPDRAAIQHAINRADLGTRVHLLGRRGDVPELLARADLFVLSSRFEGLPNAVIEAMAAEVPVVATRVGGVGELVDDGVTGWLVPPSAPVSLADAIRGALGADRTRIAVAARQRAERLFAAPVMTRAFDAIYRELAA